MVGSRFSRADYDMVACCLARARGSSWEWLHLAKDKASDLGSWRAGWDAALCVLGFYFADLFSKDNPRFSAELFFTAAGMAGLGSILGVDPGKR